MSVLRVARCLPLGTLPAYYLHTATSTDWIQIRWCLLVLVHLCIFIWWQTESRLQTHHVLHSMRLLAHFLITCVRVAGGLAAMPAVAQPAPATPRQWVSPPPGDVQRGAALYQQHCTVCHSVELSKIGPAHRGVLGRRVGSLAGYKYSKELAASRLRWTPQTLFVWLGEPEDLVAGQRMGFAIENEQERGDLIAYLATLK